MNDAEAIADVLSQVVEIGAPPAEAGLGDAVIRHVSTRPAVPARPRPNLGLATTAELLDELRARIDVAGLADHTTFGGSP
jgi:hypothetical protein